MTARGQLWFDLAVFVGVIALCWHQGWTWDQMEVHEVGHFGTVFTVFAVWRVARREPYRAQSAATIYLTALCLFHFGLTSALALGIEPNETVEEGSWFWLARDQAVPAARYALMGVAGCAAGTTIAALTTPLLVPALPSGPDVDRTLGVVAANLTLWGVAAWMALLVRSAGVEVFFGSYMGMRDAIVGSSIGFIYLMINLGVPLLAATTWGPWHRWGLGAFGLFALLGFPLGLRGEVLFPFASVLVVWARQGRRVDLVRMALIAAVVLASAAAVRDLRVVGIGNVYEARQVSANPLNGLMELGGTLRPVVEVVRWYEEGDDYILGASYIAPFERPLGRLVPGMTRIPAEDDERLMNVLVMNRDVGPIGFSPIAEAYRNFGPLGVVLVMALTGFVVARLDQLPRDPTSTSLVGVVFVPILTQVRNSFIAVPFGVGAGVALVLVTAWIYGARSASRPASSSMASDQRPASR